LSLFFENREKKEPLAARLRPRSLEEFVGQEEIVGEGTLLRKAIAEDRVPSMILFGPPGSGKTSLAFVIANITKASWERLSAVTAGVSEVRKVIERAKERRKIGGKTILFIDEIHRFNKAQQDALLPAVEDGTVILIGSTTENPFFEVNSPLLSRCRIYTLKPLSQNEVKKILLRAMEDKERGLGNEEIFFEKGVVDLMASLSNGDARVALNLLEMTFENAPEEKGVKKITKKLVEEASQKRFIYYDRAGDYHYDTVSAFIKSLRGSDPDAALYYLARMIKAGEDPKFIARRMVIFASEDIGNADPQALVIATAAFQAVQFVGFPEARLNLAQAAIYLATAPKSNSVIKAIDKALKDLEEEPPYPVPKHLRDSHYPGAKKLGHGKGYKYPHDYSQGYVEQDYFPSEKKKRSYYFPKEVGFEREIMKRMERIKKKEGK
jgi:putative ATPase